MKNYCNDCEYARTKLVLGIDEYGDEIFEEQDYCELGNEWQNDDTCVYFKQSYMSKVCESIILPDRIFQNIYNQIQNSVEVEE